MRIAVLLLSIALVTGAYAQEALTFSIPSGAGVEGYAARSSGLTGQGLFAGDNINEEFANGDGVAFYLNFDVSQLPAGSVQSAALSSEHALIRGAPFDGLGRLIVQQVKFSKLEDASKAEKAGEGCVLGEHSSSSYECDISKALQDAIDDGRQNLQLRVMFDLASDKDGKADIISFYRADGDKNGVFEIDAQILPSGQKRVLKTESGTGGQAFVGAAVIFGVLLFALMWKAKPHL